MLYKRHSIRFPIQTLSLIRAGWRLVPAVCVIVLLAGCGSNTVEETSPQGLAFGVAKIVPLEMSELPEGLDPPRLVPGDLDGDGRPDWVFFHGSRFIKAFSHDGERLWVIDRPDGTPNKAPWHPYISAVWDLDNDGRDEVITVLQHEDATRKPFLAILDGMTGEVLKQTDLDFVPSEYGNHSRRGLVSIAYLQDPDVPCILVGFDDVNNQAEVFDVELNRLWRHDIGPNQGDDWWIPGSGHYLWPHDLDGDGTEEVFIGKYLYDGDGRQMYDLWEGLTDHVDSLVCGDFRKDIPGMEAVFCGEAGLRMVNINPETLDVTTIWDMPSGQPVRNPQSLNVGQFYAAAPGLEILVAERGSEEDPQTYLLAADGTAIRHFDGWITGMGADLDGYRDQLEIHMEEGAVLNPYGERILTPAWHGPLENAHLYSLSMDVLGDPREEILVWNREQLIIGTSTRKLDKQLSSFRDERGYRRVYSANRYLNRGARFFDYGKAP